MRRGWYEKQVLTETDLVEIQTAIDEKNARVEAEEAAKAEDTVPETVSEEPAPEETEEITEIAETAEV